MKTTKLFAITTVAALLAGGFIVTNSVAAGNNAGQRRLFGGGRLLERGKEKLGLTQGQVEEIKSVLKAERENITSLMSRMHEARAELRGKIQDANATEASVRVAAAKVAAVEADAAVERMKLYRQISPILTDEQRSKLSELQSRLDTLIDKAIDRANERPVE